MNATAPACPRCGAPAGGEYCVECGGRFPRRARFGDPPRLGPPGRAWPLLSLLVVAATGALVAVAATRDDTRQTVVAVRYRQIHGARPAATAQAPATLAAATLPDVRPAVPIPRRPRPTSSPSRLTTWTLGDGYTAVLASVPSATDRPAARRMALRALGKGLTQVGILDSQRYSSLHPGYLVVFSGMFDSFAAAASRVTRAKAEGFPSAYARQITR